MARFKDRNIVVTGGASGIGEATVRALVGEGASVVIADLQEDRGHALAEELGESALFLRTDVTAEEDVVAAIALLQERFGALHGMVNNAGVVGAVGSIMETSVEAYERTMSILSRAVFLGIKHAARAMRDNGSGAIVSLASTAGVMGGHGPHVYTMAKHGVVGITRSASSELASLGIRVNAVAPGGVLTPMTENLGQENAREVIAANNPLGVACMPGDIASGILFLLSDDARQISGHTLVIDAGVTTGGQPAAFHLGETATLLQAGETAAG
ncbi:MAG: short-chain dehydrogenase [Halioglobus sp.]|nr:short-chain dehydrogenase [Halioglobus sp.]